MNLLIATAGFAEIPEADVRQFEFTVFLFSLVPAILYFLGVAVFWVSVNWTGLRQQQVSVRALAVLVTLTLPGIIWLMLFVVWSYWWFDQQEIGQSELGSGGSKVNFSGSTTLSIGRRVSAKTEL